MVTKDNENMPSVKINENALIELRKALPQGSISRIAKNNKVTRESVRQILKGTWFNEGVINDSIKEARKARDMRRRYVNEIVEIVQ